MDKKKQNTSPGLFDEPKDEMQNFLLMHKQDFTDLVKAAKKDSIYSSQNLEEAMPIIFSTIYKHTEKLESMLEIEMPNCDPTVKNLALIQIYVIRLPYCTKVSQIQKMGINLNRAAVPLMTKYNPSSFGYSCISSGKSILRTCY